ncbi:MAG TPA: hypothetical protein VMU24_05600, partial [Candidatus Acidoferrales bacterium]|nr:hypothetical protein [Candidatus Acidoferrales bacterium]
MKSWTTLLLLILLGMLPAALQAENVDLLPAGMLLTCSMDEPQFSAKTAAVGDPVLCHLSTTAFGRQVLPRGSYLTGRLEDYREPGHFVGKGWLLIQFDRLVLPGEGIMPLSAKVISVPKYKVDKEGRIDGKGHATRDAVEWSIPLLWPIKIITLPARGPYVTLKGETRITVRLMEDIELPVRVSDRRVPMPPWARPSSFLPRSDSETTPLVMNAVRTSPAVVYQRPVAAPIALTVLVMNDQSAELVQAYWLEGNQIHCVARDGSSRLIPVS